MQPIRNLLLLALAIISSANHAVAQRGRPMTPPNVIATRATVVSFPLVVEALGNARANESVEIRAHISESIRSIQFQEGQRVEANQTLVELNDAEARAEVAVARAKLVDMESQYRRARDLYETRAVSESEFDQRSAQRDAMRAELNAAEARLADSNVRAPFAGRVGLRNVSLGTLVTPETVITTLDDTDTIKLDFDIPETWLSMLATGLRVEARSAAWQGETFRGEVASIDTRVDPVSRTVTVRARIPNPAGHLRAGMFLTVILVRNDINSLVVPEQAMVPQQSQQFVFVIGEDQRVEKRAVRTGRRRPGQVEILEGLTAGERIVAEGTQQARPGELVNVVSELEVEDAAPESAP